MLKGLGAMGDMAKMMKAAKTMQEKMTRLQQELEETVVQGESGAGLVRAEATAKGELVSLKIDPSIFQAEDKEVVEDLILAAIKDVQRRAQDHTAQQMQRIQAEMGLPADMKLPI